MMNSIRRLVWNNPIVFFLLVISIVFFHFVILPKDGNGWIDLCHLVIPFLYVFLWEVNKEPKPETTVSAVKS